MLVNSMIFFSLCCSSLSIIVHTFNIDEISDANINEKSNNIQHETIDSKSFDQIIGQHVPEVNCIRSCPKNKFGSCLIPYRRGSQYYYRCVEGKPMFLSCPPAMIYSQQFHKCLPLLQHPILPTTGAGLPLSPALATGGLPLTSLNEILSLSKEPNFLILSLVQNIGGISQLLTLMLKKVVKIDRRVRLSSRRLTRMNLFLLQAVQQSALICKSRLSLNQGHHGHNSPFGSMHNFKNDSDPLDAEFQALLDQKVFEAFDAEDSMPNPNANPGEDGGQSEAEKLKAQQELDAFQKIIESAGMEFKPKDDFDEDEDSDDDLDSVIQETFKLGPTTTTTKPSNDSQSSTTVTNSEATSSIPTEPSAKMDDQQTISSTTVEPETTTSEQQRLQAAQEAQAAAVAAAMSSTNIPPIQTPPSPQQQQKLPENTRKRILEQLKRMKNEIDASKKRKMKKHYLNNQHHHHHNNRNSHQWQSWL